MPEKIDDFEIHHFIIIIMSNNIFLESICDGPFRDTTLHSLCRSFATWIKAFSLQRKLNGEDFVLIRGRLSSVVQEIDLIKYWNSDYKIYFIELLRDCGI